MNTTPQLQSEGRPLYSDLLGGSWSLLDASVRQAHAGRGVRGVGEFDIRHGRRRLARLLARWLRLTRPGTAVPTQLTVTPTADGESWDRRFADATLLSTQRFFREGLLVERFGCIEFLFSVAVTDGGIAYRPAEAAFGWGRLRIGLPRWLAPRVTADERPGERAGRVRVRVRVALPVLGELLSYSGYFDVEVNP